MTQSTQDTLPDDLPHKTADDSEQVYFEGSPQLLAELGKVVSFGFVGLILLIVPIANLVKWKNDWPWWSYLVLLILGVVVMFWPMLMRKTLRYRITSYRIDVISGVLARNSNTIELWHVEDLKLHQSLLNRLVDVGTITITARDQTLPVLPLHGLPRPQELFRMLEQRVIAVKRQPGVMKVDPG